jgi:small-conductance mechanosensitive channel
MGATFVSEVLILALWARRFGFALLDWAMARRGSEELVRTGFFPLLRNTLTLVLVLSGLIVVLQYFGFDVMGLVTALGVGSLAVGLAAKDTLSNMISGFTIIIDHNFQPGDRVSVGGSSGEVDEIGLRSTRIRTPSGTTWVVPNSELVNTKILNQGSRTQGIQASTRIRVSLGSDFSEASRLASRIASGIPAIDGRREVRVSLQALADGFQTIEVSFWVLAHQEMDSAVSLFLERWLKEAPGAGIQTT